MGDPFSQAAQVMYCAHMGEANVEALRRVHQTGMGRSSGLPVEARLAHVWTVADGKAVRWKALPDHDAALGDGG